MRIAFDTNVLAYAEGSDDVAKQQVAGELVAALNGHELVLPLQTAAELHQYLVRKKRKTRREAHAALSSWQAIFAREAGTTATVLASALELATEHQFQIFDAIILAASAEAECRLLLSEDMQDGFVWSGVTVVNPFVARPHPLLADLLRT